MTRRVTAPTRAHCYAGRTVSRGVVSHVPIAPTYPPAVIRDNLASMLPAIRRERTLREMQASDETMGWRR